MVVACSIRRSETIHTTRRTRASTPTLAALPKAETEHPAKDGDRRTRSSDGIAIAQKDSMSRYIVRPGGPPDDVATLPDLGNAAHAADAAHLQNFVHREGISILDVPHHVLVQGWGGGNPGHAPRADAS